MATLAPKLPYTHPFAGGYPGRGSQRLPSDPDALAYLAAVAAADGAAVEVGVAMAVDDFIRGCKADGIWDAIKASCILCGARTLAGALVPLVGAAPTNNNFVSGDYNRETGLIGNGSTKYLNSNRANNADPQDSKHIGVYNSTHHGRDVVRGFAGTASGLGGSQLLTSATTRIFRINLAAVGADTAVLQDTSAIAGFTGVTRTGASAVTTRYNQTSTSFGNTASQTPNADAVDIFRRDSSYSDGRLAFYSIGESLDLALLDARVSALVTAIGNAI